MKRKYMASCTVSLDLKVLNETNSVILQHIPCNWCRVDLIQNGHMEQRAMDTLVNG